MRQILIATEPARVAFETTRHRRIQVVATRHTRVDGTELLLGFIGPARPMDGGVLSNRTGEEDAEDHNEPYRKIAASTSSEESFVKS